MNMQVRPPLMPMSGEQRSALRRAVVQSPEWKVYRDDNDLSMDKITTQELWDAAYALGLDAVTIISPEGMAVNAQEEHHKPRPFDAESVEKLRERYRALSTNQISDKDAVLCNAIFITIRQKQDGRATVKQFETIDRIVTRAEQGRQGSERAQGSFGAGNGHDVPETPKAAQEASKVPLPSSREELLRQLLAPQIDEAQLEAVVNAKIAKALEGIPTVRIELATQNGEARTLDGHHHPMFARLLKMAVSRGVDGFVPNIWLSGPAGSGKTHGAKMLAKALNLAWHYNGALSMPHELLGFRDARGNFHRTPFREAYEHGGVYLFDEVDASDNSALLALNAALANGTATFPDGQVQRHVDCIIIATANTWGLGATADYVGRSKLDAAFLSRFPGRLPWEYDSALEVAISGNANFARRVIDARERARKHGIKVIIDPRASIAGSAYIANGFSSDEAADMTYLANLTPEHRKLVEGH
jgi:cobaltochelatase CobS